jgi:hypothetical protein
MIWARRHFAAGEDCGAYHVRLADLQMAMADHHREFMMVARKTGKPGVGEEDVYIALPDEGLLSTFDGFEVIPESELPKEVDDNMLSDASEFDKRFTIRGLP